MKFIRQYKKGNCDKYFLRSFNGMYFFERSTKASGLTLKAGSEDEVIDFINNGGYKFVGLIATRSSL